MSEQKKYPYELISGSHHAYDTEKGENVEYGPGGEKVLLLTDEQADSPTFAGRLRPLSGRARATAEEAADAGKTGEPKSTKQFSDIGDKKVDEVIDIIEKIEDVAKVKALRDAEVAGKGRKGILDAADVRINELS